MNEAFKIVYEDTYLIVLNKIAKLLIEPSPKRESYTLTRLLEKHLKKKVYPCHRLDRETTGLIIYAKEKDVQRKIMEAFRKRKIRKRYFALIKGRLSKKSGILEGYVLDREGARFGERPKMAKTLFRVLKEKEEFSFLKLEPITGRTNQLRIQLAKIGNPILGERKYACGKDFKVRFSRLALHAYSLSFLHPITKRPLTLKIDLPSDMKNFLSRYVGS